MRLAAGLICAGTLALPLAGCGGGSDRAAAPPVQSPAAARDGAVRVAAATALTAAGSEARCARTLTPRLVDRIYGSVARCRRLLDNDGGVPDDDARVLAVRVSGARATARVTAILGDSRGPIAGTVRLRYTADGGWRVDDFEGDELRGGLGSAVAAALQILAPSTESAVTACVRRRFAAAGDARVQRVAYGVMGRRAAGLRAAYRELAACRSGPVSLLRRLFERQLTVTFHPRPPVTFACVRRGLRVTVSDAFVARVLAAGGTSSAHGLELLVPRVGRVARACGGAPGAAGASAIA